MAAQDGLTFEGTFNSAISGLFKNNTTNEIEEIDSRALVTAIRESYLNRIDDAYTGVFPQFTTTTSTTAYVGIPNPAITAYATGQKFQVKVHATSTGNATLNLSGIGAKKIFTTPTTQATTNDLVINTIYMLFYDAALDTGAGGFLMIGGSGGGGSVWGAIIGTITDQTDLVSYVTAQIAAAVAGLLDLRGNFDASGNAYPSSGGSGTAGAILKADAWVISVAGTLPTGQAASVGDVIFALQDTPGNTQANWARLEMNLLQATSTVAGIVKLYTALGTNTDGGIDQNTANTNFNLKANLASPTFTGTPAAPTATAGTNTTQLATTAFVNEAQAGSKLFLYYNFY